MTIRRRRTHQLTEGSAIAMVTWSYLAASSRPCSVSAVIKPGSNNKSRDPLKFVKIQSTELSRKAVEQIRLAEEVKVTKEKIKEVEEEWQSNLLNWKSKRRQSKETTSKPNSEENDDNDMDGEDGNGKRKIKTFTEILHEKAKSGHRLGYNLHRYVEGEEDSAFGPEVYKSQQSEHRTDNQFAANRKQMSENVANNQRNDSLSKQDHQIVDVNRQLTEQRLHEGERKMSDRDAKVDCPTARRRQHIEHEKDGTCPMAAIYKSDSDQVKSLSGNGLSETSGNISSAAEKSNNRTANDQREDEEKEEAREDVDDDGKSSEQARNERNVWGYLIEQQQQEAAAVSAAAVTSARGDASQARAVGEARPSLSDYDEDDLMNESVEACDQVAQQLQMINFKAKLSAFEKLAKQPLPSTAGSETALSGCPVTGFKEEPSDLDTQTTGSNGVLRRGDAHQRLAKSTGNLSNGSHKANQNDFLSQRPVGERPVAVGAEDFSRSSLVIAAPRTSHRPPQPPPSARDLQQRGEPVKVAQRSESRETIMTRHLVHQAVQEERGDVEGGANPGSGNLNHHQVQEQVQQQSYISQNNCQTVVHSVNQQQDLLDYDAQMNGLTGRLSRSHLGLKCSTGLPSSHSATVASSSGTATVIHGHDQLNHGYPVDQLSAVNHSQAALISGMAANATSVAIVQRALPQSTSVLAPLNYYHVEQDQEQQQQHQVYVNQQQQQTGNRMYDQQQYFYLEDELGQSRVSTKVQPIQEPLYSNNHQEQLHYIHQLAGSSSGTNGKSLIPKSQPAGQSTSSSSAPSLRGGGGGAGIGNASHLSQQQLSSFYYPKPYSQSSTHNQNFQQHGPAASVGQQAAAPVTGQQGFKSVVPPPPSRHMEHGGGIAMPPPLAANHAGYNRNHWLIQEAELRRQIAASNKSQLPRPVSSNQQQQQHAMDLKGHIVSVPVPVTQVPMAGLTSSEQIYENLSQAQLVAQQKQNMLSVSGRKKCSSCADELGRGCAAMVIESLSLYYHINCFRCSVCHIQLGNGTCGTDVRVRNHKLHCNNCYSNDEAGLKFSRV
ncbi:LIM and calponin homology domains-containing protein 1 [Halotydeus destructor]|nr:LIM and calponin homology domains-containing protein 1 [Halotydeus destructor]